ncbi:hypothetical protein FQA39_LY04911 [Lamprigera yunnana]|nr:hypothetical protein FQA39_LY04911 [Lamprigera yunnana]
MVCRVGSKYSKLGHIHNLPKSGRPSPSEDQLNIMLAAQENHQSILNQLTSNSNKISLTAYKIIKNKALYKIMEYHNQDHHKMNVRCGIVDARIPNPYVADVNLIGATYLDVLRYDLIPENDFFFQHGGVPSHLIGEGGQSSDQPTADYFLWGYLKIKVNVSRLQNLENLKARFCHELQHIPPEVFDNFQNGFIYRLGYCQEFNGLQFEHLI